VSAQGKWGWRPHQAEGIWRHGCAWTKPLFAAVPWITLTLLLALFAFIGDRLPQVPGLVCDLPQHVAGQAVATGLAALVLPGAKAGDETLVFFDDARYSLSDDSSVSALKERLGARSLAEPSSTFLLLADKRVPAGDVLKLVGIARESGLSRVQIAERRE
jgi:biopolymer transport protein ExbD